MKKKLFSLFLALILLITHLSALQAIASPAKALSGPAAASTVTTLTVNSGITQWVLDEANKTLFAIFGNSKMLLCINTETLKVSDSIALSGSPTDIAESNGNLYIAIDAQKKIVVVNAITKTITKTIDTISDPYRIAIDGDKLYYTTFNNSCDIYENNLNSEAESKLQIPSFLYPDLAINTASHILYVGESHCTGSKLYYISTETNKVVGKSNYNDNYGFSVSDRIILFDGKYVFFAGRAFNPSDPKYIEGDYNGKQTILFSGFGCACTNSSIYDRDTHVKLGDFKNTVDLIEGTGNIIYTYNDSTYEITKYSSQIGTITSMNIISIVAGTSSPAIPAVTNSTSVTTGIRKLKMQSQITQWITDETGKNFYVISAVDKSLFFIDSATLNIQSVIHFTSSPTDIILNGTDLYISLADISQIKVIDCKTKMVKKTLHTSSDPYRIVIDGTKLYYTETDQFCNIYEYNLVTGSDSEFISNTFCQPDLAINASQHIIYIGESGGTGSHLFYYNSITKKYISQTGTVESGYDCPARTVVFDGKYVLYAGRAYDSKEPLRQKCTFPNNQNIVSSNKGVVFTTNQFYDETTFKRIYSISANTELVLFSNDGKLYSYSETTQSIECFDSMSRYIKSLLIKPTGLTATAASCTAIELWWNNDGATGHCIYRSTASTGTYTNIGKSTTTSFVNSSLSTGKKYYYKILTYVTYNGTNIYGSYSSVISVTVIPPAPFAPSAVSTSYNSIKVYWMPVTGVSGYVLYRYNTITKLYDKLITTSATNYIDTSLSTGTVYKYKVKAYKTINGKNIYSDYSNYESCMPVPATPGTFKVFRINDHNTILSWNSVTGASGYEIYYGSLSNWQFKLLATTTSTTFIQTDLNILPDAIYQVRAYRVVNDTKIYGAFTSFIAPL